MLRQKIECKNGRRVTLEIDENADYRVEAKNSLGSLIGRMEFSEDSESGSLKLVWAYLDILNSTWRRQGIGRQMLKEVKSLSGRCVFAETNDGIKREDGSHLTGDAPSFVAQMRVEGIIEPDNSNGYDSC